MKVGFFQSIPKDQGKRAAKPFIPQKSQHATSLTFALAFYSIGQAIDSAQIQPCKGGVSKNWWPCLILLIFRYVLHILFYIMSALVYLEF